MLTRLLLGKGATVDRKAPTTVVIVCATIFASLVLGCFTILAYYGKDATEIRSLINTLLNIAAIILSGGTLVYSGIAAKRSDEAASNTNGKLKETIRQEIHSAVGNAMTNGKGDDNGGSAV